MARSVGLAAIASAHVVRLEDMARRNHKLREMLDAGAEAAEIALKLKRTRGAVYSRISYHARKQKKAFE